MQSEDAVSTPDVNHNILDALNYIAGNIARMDPQAALSPTDRILIATVFVSLVAIGVAVWTAYLQRKFQRASAAPLLVEEIVLPHGEEGKMFATIGFKNIGLGPALIREVRLYTHKKEIEHGHLNWKVALESLGLFAPEHRDQLNAMLDTDGIGISQTVILFGATLHKPSAPEGTSAPFDDSSARILAWYLLQFEVDYVSIFARRSDKPKTLRIDPGIYFYRDEPDRDQQFDVLVRRVLDIRKLASEDTP